MIPHRRGRAILHYRSSLAFGSDCYALVLLNSPILNFPTELTFSTQHAHAADETSRDPLCSACEGIGKVINDPLIQQALSKNSFDDQHHHRSTHSFSIRSASYCSSYASSSSSSSSSALLLYKSISTPFHILTFKVAKNKTHKYATEHCTDL
jgi:hypothetical protein